MFSFRQTRDSARALAGAAVAGAAVGAVFASAWLAAVPARATADQTVPDVVAQADPSLTLAAAPSVPQTVRAQGDRSAELLKASLAGPAARPYRAQHGATDLECLTQAIYYEARGEGRAGQAAVAQVVLNRVRHPAFPRSVCAVVFQGCQFSFACDGSMGARRNGRAWDRARRVAEEALAGAVMANIGNATHFHTINVSPNWAPRLIRVGQVGLHVFYRFGGRNGRPGAFSDEALPSQPEPGLHEYRRLTPEERVYLTSAVLRTRVAVSETPQAGIGGPIGPVSEPASAPAAAKATAQPKPAAGDAAKPAPATPVKASAEAPIATARPSAVTAS